MEIVGEASDGLEAIKLNGALHPDLILMDLSMPVMDGLSASKIIKNSSPDTRILLFSSHNMGGLIKAAKALGLNGFVPKEKDSEALAEAWAAVAHSQTYFPN
jgi:DNA-binding NarL/FixJ family response regulator